MSAALRSFMGAYNAVHNQESREELYAKRDELSEMDLSLISDVELDEIAEVALQELFEKGFTVNQADAIFDNLITEAKVTYGHDTESARQAKVQRLKGALKGAIGKARMKSARGAVAAYGAYRSAKQTADDIRRRTTQTAKNVSAQTAKKASEAKAGVKTGLKGMIKKAAEKVASKASGVAKRMDEAKKGDGNLANNYPPYDKVTRGDIIAGAKGEDQMGGKNIRGNDSKAQKARLEKKRGMKLDDHPQFKEELEATGKFTAQEIEAIIEKI